MFKSKEKLYSLKLHDFYSDTEEMYILSAHSTTEAFDKFIRDCRTLSEFTYNQIMLLRNIGCGTYSVHGLILIIKEIYHEGVVKKLPLTPIFK